MVSGGNRETPVSFVPTPHLAAVRVLLLGVILEILLLLLALALGGLTPCRLEPLSIRIAEPLGLLLGALAGSTSSGRGRPLSLVAHRLGSKSLMEWGRGCKTEKGSSPRGTAGGWGKNTRSVPHGPFEGHCPYLQAL